MSLIIKPYGMRFFFSALLIIGLLAIFWSQSRYPALNEKAIMSGAIQLEDPLGFEAKFPIKQDMAFVEKVGLSTLNWLNTNKKGMTFGILFAAAFLTLGGYLRQKSFQNPVLNALAGMVVGAPLGVCVNCAAPIARGLYAGGARAETALAMMIASPTLNIVVLTMAFSLLPFYIAATKLFLSVLLILFGIPLLCRLLPTTDLTATSSSPIPAPTAWEQTPPRRETPLIALLQTAKAFAHNLWFILKLTLPLMVLAGFLGALVATLLPTDLIVDLPFAFSALILIAIVGTFLPVPIAFDVVVCGALLSLGLAHGFVAALVFTLGSFSIYSYFIIAQAISWRAANLMTAAVVALGVLAGLAAQAYQNDQTDKALELLLGYIRPAFGAAYAGPAPTVLSQNSGNVTLTPQAFSTKSSAASTAFTRLEGWEIGISKPIEFSFQDMWPPFWEGRSLSTGDIDHDGDTDLIIASTVRGLYGYENDGSGTFTALNGLAAFDTQDVFNAALVDIDNDHWLDLFVTTYQGGNYILRNENGVFVDTPLSVPNTEAAVLTLALSFGDIDQDGDLDVALGNWTAGWYRRIPGEESRNSIVLNEGGLLTNSLALPGVPGETLSILLSDINGDLAPDLIVGNDFEVPDMIYLSSKDGLSAVSAQSGLVPYTTTTTMAVKTADLHNSGSPEIYFAQIAGRSSGISDRLHMQPLEQYCDVIKRDADQQICRDNMEIKAWYKSGNRFDPSKAGKCAALPEGTRGECKAMMLKDLAIQKNDASICGLIPRAQAQAKQFCEIHFRPTRPISEAEHAAGLEQIQRSNVLLTRDGAGWKDAAVAQGLEVGGWSWDTKIADFDNDGFQDVYIVNGTWVPNEVSPSNIFFRNTGDGAFVEMTEEFGLTDYLMTAAAAVFDLDGDGDLDIVTHPVNGPITVFRNNLQSEQAISVKLRDDVGNSEGIGARITLTMDDQTQQYRELQIGGGFMSFDAPVAHFGLGAPGSGAPEIVSLSVDWPTGEQTLIDGPFAKDQSYLIHRHVP
jgi:uncharacterized membrane protein YraQ (UPF0718 family)